MIDEKKILTSAVKITAGTPVPPGKAVFVDGKSAGRVRLYLQTGYIEFDFEKGPTLLVDLGVTDFTVVSGSADVSVLA